MAQEEKVSKTSGETEEKIQEGQAPFFVKYRNIIFGALAVIILGVAFFLYNQNRKQEKNMEGMAALRGAIYNFEQDSLQRAITGYGQWSGLSTLAGEYEGTKAGKLAAYYLGTAQIALGNLEAGVSNVQVFEGESHFVATSALTAQAYAAEEKGDFAKAAELYEQAAVTPEENEYTTPLYLMEAGRNYEAIGNSSKALEVYNKVKFEYPNHPKALSIDKYIGRLSVEANQ